MVDRRPSLCSPINQCLIVFSPIINRISMTVINLYVLTGIQLRAYQLDGVQWLIQCLNNQQGCILGDEMGLGKTCQVCENISLLVKLTIKLHGYIHIYVYIIWVWISVGTVSKTQVMFLSYQLC